MKKITFLFSFLSFFFTVAQTQLVEYDINPCTFQEGDNITITFEGSSINESTWGVAGNALYLWAWSFDTNDENTQDCPTNGTWTSSSETNRLTYNSGSDTYSISFVPTTFYDRTGLGRIGFLIKAKDGTGDKKSQDITAEIGENNFQVIFSSPTEPTTLINSGDDLTITATNTCGNADYVLKANGSIINSQSNTSSYTYTDMNITENKSYSLEVTLDGDTQIIKGFALLDHSTVSAIMPQNYQDGINYDDSDPTKATLVLYATGKDFVYVAGSFNNWVPTAAHAMKRDFTRNNKFWITLEGLTPGQLETYQYWVVDRTPLTDTQSLVKVADPYSTLVLNNFDDPYIPASTYPDLPPYPEEGDTFEVSVLQTDQTPYNWQVTNFSKPKKEDLVVYEALIRDFDADRNFQDLIDKIDYFKNLNINAIELMPVMEFEGNEGWGYNTAHHMALDKFYGTADKLKEFIDLCHQNDIAVILDIALNHAFGRNSMVRMWAIDPDGNGYGPPSSENPYFNETARHAYSVGEDFDHSNAFTKVYVKRVIKHWIEEFKIDGFRWDLTKGFTQLCTSGDESCTNGTPADRVAILKDYVDYSWSLDETHYAIFEHLGIDSEEQQWANYRLGDAIPKGVMMWSEMWNDYKELANGNSSNFDRMGHTAHGFTEKRTLGYPESHDKDRIMYEMTEFGGGSGFDLNTSLTRMSALGAVTIPIPGPKMIWHFADLGMDDSIWTCNDSSVNSDYDGNNDGDCKLDTKPQPQWTENWLGDPNRSQVRSDWARLIELKINEDVFEGDYAINSGTQTPRIYVFDNSLPASQLKNVVILANFSTSAQNVTPDFPYIGTWYDLMDETGSTSIEVLDTEDQISIPAGGFKIYGNQSSIALDTDDILGQESFAIFPNPATYSFKLNKNVSHLVIYDITGKLIVEYKGTFEKGESFDISNLKSGIYIVELKNKFDQKMSSKLIKL